MAKTESKTGYRRKASNYRRKRYQERINYDRLIRILPLLCNPDPIEKPRNPNP